jgi:glycosyltransferase involved in cell wall biosynthesis
MSNKLPISAIIITNRDDFRLQLSLKSLEFADEILVEKTGIISDFSTIRNECIKKAKHEWVFFLDSDEYLQPCDGFYNSIEAMINNDLISGVNFNRVDIFHGKKMHWGETRNNFQLRLFRKNVYYFSGKVHEVLIPRVIKSFSSTNNDVKRIVNSDEVAIIHNSHLSISEFIQDVTNYAKIHSQNLSNNKSKLKLEMIIFPAGKFLMNYFLKLGFLDGWRGLVYAIVMSLHSLISRVIAYENNTKNNS